MLGVTKSSKSRVSRDGSDPQRRLDVHRGQLIRQVLEDERDAHNLDAVAVAARAAVRLACCGVGGGAADTARRLHHRREE